MGLIPDYFHLAQKIVDCYSYSIEIMILIRLPGRSNFDLWCPLSRLEPSDSYLHMVVDMGCR